MAAPTGRFDTYNNSIDWEVGSYTLGGDKAANCEASVKGRGTMWTSSPTGFCYDKSI